MERFEHVRQMVLLTDERHEQHTFCTTLGFQNTRDLVNTPLNAYVRFKNTMLS